MSAFKNKCALVFWFSVPMLVTLLFVILYVLPKHAFAFSNVMPLLHMASIFYWGMLGHRQMPYWFVFAMGVLIDVVTGLPLGLSSLVYILFVVFMRMQRRFVHKEGFLINWAFFSALLLVMSGVQWLLVTSLGSTQHALLPLFMQWLITAFCYPVVSRIFDVLQALISSRRLTLLHTK